MGLFTRTQVSRKLQVAVTVAVVGVIISTAIGVGPVSAAIDYSAEIKKLQSEQDANASNRSQLQTAAVSLEQKLANLQTSIDSLNTQIKTNQNTRDDLAAKIAANAKQIATEQDALGELVRQMYVQDDVSMMEKMASSKNLSEYVEKEAYGISMQTRLDQSLDHINTLKKEQEGQKALTEQLIKDNQAMQAQAIADRQEADRLLAMNQQQQATYTQSIAAASSQISDLQRQQAEENLRIQREQAAAAEAARKAALANPGAPSKVTAAQMTAPAGVKTVSGSSYPYANAPFPNELADPWGMYQRQCVSYTAWKVAASGRHMPYWGGFGNANQWDDNAVRAGIPTDGTPRVGDVAVSNKGTYGHVMYVEAVNSDGSINISQYNAGWDGRYSEARIMPTGLVFIHF